MKTLVVEDDFGSQKLLEKFLKPFGPVVVVDDGKVALEAFSKALNEKSPFDLICLDIMLPHVSGQEVLKKVREMEELVGIFGLKGVKIIMITALHDPENIMEAFRYQCESYLTKPLKYHNLIEELENLNLLPQGTPKKAFPG